MPGAGDDHIALAEPDTRSLGAVLVPQARDLCLDRGVLGYELRVVAERKRPKQLASVLGELLDLGPDVIKRLIISPNASALVSFPYPSRGCEFL